MYYLVKTEIDHGFYDSAIVQASSAEQAQDTLQQIADLFGYTVQSVTPMGKAKAMAMIQANKAHGIRATKTPRLKLKQEPATVQNPMNPKQRQQIENAVSELTDEGLQCFLNYVYFLKAIDQQPKLS